MTEKPVDCIMLGYKLGTCSGWDRDIEVIGFYDFIPVEELKWPKETTSITIDMIEGRVQGFDNEGQKIYSTTWRDLVRNLP